MRQLGKQLDVFRYRGGTHSFLRYQVEGENGAATQDAWPRATAFLKSQLQAGGGNR
jgi:dienelactone hydrolase